MHNDYSLSLNIESDKKKKMFSLEPHDSAIRKLNSY